MDSFWFPAIALVSAVVFGLFGQWVAREKGRGLTEGTILGVFFGPLGVLIEALLPNRR